jgi:heterodisulfide reductase subunit C
MATTTVRISSTKLRSPFVAQVERLSGQKLLACYQCGKCSAGCPMAAHMDILPNQMIRLAQLGMKERLLGSRAIWTCVSCMTCNSRCPKGVRIAEIIEALRDIALRAGRRNDHLHIGDVPAATRGALPPIAMISAMRKLTS